MADVVGVVLALLQLRQEVLTVKLVDLLNVAEDDVAFAAQRVWHIVTHDLRDVVLDDELEGSDVVTLRLDHLPHDETESSEIVHDRF